MVSSINPFYALSYANIASLFGAAAASPSGVTATIAGSSSATTAIASTNDPAKAIQAILAQAEVAKAPAAAASASGVSSTVESAYAAQTSLEKVSGSFADPSLDTYDVNAKVDLVQQAYTPQAEASAPSVGASTSSALSVAAQNMDDAATSVTTPGIVIDGTTYGISDSTLAISTISQSEAGARTETASVLAGENVGRILAVRQAATLLGAQQNAGSSEESGFPGGTSSTDTSPAETASTQPVKPTYGRLALQLQIAISDDPNASADGAFNLAASQAKQIVSSYEQYLAKTGPATLGTGFTFMADYGPNSTIVISGMVKPDVGQTDMYRSLDDGKASSPDNTQSFFLSL